MGWLTRFLKKVQFTKNGCWEWRAATCGAGYGQFCKDGKQRLAHRVIYEHLVGPIPAKMQIDHLCRNRGCVNPLHMEIVTNRENGIRGAGPAARFNNTHCQHGHELSGDNLRLYKRGENVWRICRTCKALTAKLRTERLRVEPLDRSSGVVRKSLDRSSGLAKVL